MLVKENIVYLFHAKLIVLEISIGFFELNWLFLKINRQGPSKY